MIYMHTMSGLAILQGQVVACVDAADHMIIPVAGIAVRGTVAVGDPGQRSTQQVCVFTQTSFHT